MSLLFSFARCLFFVLIYLFLFFFSFSSNVFPSLHPSICVYRSSPSPYPAYPASPSPRPLLFGCLSVCHSLSLSPPSLLLLPPTPSPLIQHDHFLSYSFISSSARLAPTGIVSRANQRGSRHFLWAACPTSGHVIASGIPFPLYCDRSLECICIKVSHASMH